MKKPIIIIFVIFFFLIIFDYINFPSCLGLEMSNVNWGFVNIVVVFTLYAVSYNILDKRTKEKENNKKMISSLLMRRCYQECMSDLESLTQETVEKYIVPKVDFNSTDERIIKNLQNSPFSNENIIMDMIKDGQVIESQVDEYFEIKEKYRKYILMRIIFHENPLRYDSIKNDLLEMLNEGIKKLKKISQSNNTQRHTAKIREGG